MTKDLAALKAEIAAVLDGHTASSRDCHLSGEYLAGLVMPIIERALFPERPNLDRAWWEHKPKPSEKP